MNWWQHRAAGRACRLTLPNAWSGRAALNRKGALQNCCRDVVNTPNLSVLQHVSMLQGAVPDCLAPLCSTLEAPGLHACTRESCICCVGATWLHTVPDPTTCCFAGMHAAAVSGHAAHNAYKGGLEPQQARSLQAWTHALSEALHSLSGR